MKVWIESIEQKHLFTLDVSKIKSWWWKGCETNKKGGGKGREKFFCHDDSFLFTFVNKFYQRKKKMAGKNEDGKEKEKLYFIKFLTIKLINK